jgi:hypothetical protein
LSYDFYFECGLASISNGLMFDVGIILITLISKEGFAKKKRRKNARI